jgi:hypothetical protein
VEPILQFLGLCIHKEDYHGQGSGKILFTASVAAIIPGPYEAVYAATKAFVQSFAEALRVEVKDKGITITSLLPGPTETNFFHRAGMDDTKVGGQKKDDPALVAKQGYDALMAGDDMVVAGSLMNKLQTAAAQLMPQAAAAKMHSSMSKPNSPDKRELPSMRMTFITAIHWNSEHTRIESFQCAGLDRKKNLGEPFVLGRSEVMAQLNAGEIFHVLEKVSCRWDVGPQLGVVMEKGKSLFNLEKMKVPSRSV